MLNSVLLNCFVPTRDRTRNAAIEYTVQSTSFLNCLVNHLSATRWLGSRFVYPVSQFFSNVFLYVVCNINTVMKKLQTVH